MNLLHSIFFVSNFCHHSKWSSGKCNVNPCTQILDLYRLEWWWKLGGKKKIRKKIGKLNIMITRYNKQIHGERMHQSKSCFQHIFQLMCSLVFPMLLTFLRLNITIILWFIKMSIIIFIVLITVFELMCSSTIYIVSSYHKSSNEFRS